MKCKPKSSYEYRSCDLCHNFFGESNSFLSFLTGNSYNMQSKLSCDSKNVIYLASYKKCRLKYIGSTTTDVRVRVRNHKSAIVTMKKTCIFTGKTPHDLSDFSFQCIDQVQATPNNLGSIDKLLITRGAYWSQQLFSLAPFGLNKRQEFHSKKD